MDNSNYYKTPFTRKIRSMRAENGYFRLTVYHAKVRPLNDIQIHLSDVGCKFVGVCVLFQC